MRAYSNNDLKIIHKNGILYQLVSIIEEKRLSNKKQTKKYVNLFKYQEARIYNRQ